MSDTIVKLQRRGQMVIPRSLREQVGVAEGTLMKVAVVEGGQFLLTPQLTINRPVITHGRKDRKQAFQELAQVVAEIRQEAKEKGVDKMSMSEINRAVAAARRDLKKTSKRPAK
jgi:AbrB family looped-hinge helix DNA binding protein